jgi:hypothetical protein
VSGRFRARRPSPALVLSALALFFSIGGSAFAVGQRLAVAQPRCANGAVKGFAYVTGDPAAGIQNIPDAYSSNAKLFGQRFDCAGGAVQIKRTRDGFQIKFNGIVGRAAVVSGADGNNADPMTVTPQSDGSYLVTPVHTGNPNFALGPEHRFIIAVF